MKKRLFLLLAVFMLLSFAACGGGEAEPTPEPEPTREPEETLVEESVSKKENDALSDEEEFDEPNGDLIQGPATITLDSVSFEIPDGWEFEEREEMLSVIRTSGTWIVITHPRERDTEELPEDLADFTSTLNFDRLGMIAEISGLTDARREEQEQFITDMQYPALLRTYHAQIWGQEQWRLAQLILFFGDTEIVSVHAVFGVFGADGDDFFEDEWLPFLRTIRFDADAITEELSTAQHTSEPAPSLVGTWLWNGSPYYVFEAGGRGTMSGSAIRWSTSRGVLAIGITPDTCGSTCLAPTEWNYILDGNQLTLTSTVIPDMTFTYTRR